MEGSFPQTWTLMRFSAIMYTQTVWKYHEGVCCNLYKSKLKPQISNFRFKNISFNPKGGRTTTTSNP